MWASFPRDLRTKENFVRNFKVYIVFLVMAFAFDFLKEVISILLKAMPRYLQWIIAFLIPLLRSIDTLTLSRFVNRIEGGQEEASQVRLEISINASCSLFIAVRLPDGNAITVFFIIAANFFHLLWMSYKIVKLNSVEVDETAESTKTERKRMIPKLVLAELTEGMTLLALQWQIMDPMTSFLVISKMDIGDIKDTTAKFNRITNNGRIQLINVELTFHLKKIFVIRLI